MKLKGKVALVTGASRGLGAAISRAFAAEGAAVAINYRKSKEEADKVVAEITSEGGEAFAVQADIRNEEAVQNMVRQIEQTFGSVDILVNNALYNYQFDPDNLSKADTLTWQEMQDQLDGTLKGSFHCVQAVIGKMKEKQFGGLSILEPTL